MPAASFLTKLHQLINPTYLSKSQLSRVKGKIYVGILHKVPEVKLGWKIMDNCYLLDGSVLRYLGQAGTHLRGEVPPNYSLFEVVIPITDTQVSGSTHISVGDSISVAPSDRRFIVPQ